MNNEPKLNQSSNNRFLGKGYVILSLLISAILITAATFCRHRDVLDKLSGKDLVFVGVAVGYFAAIFIAYAIISSASKKATAGNAVSLSLIISGVGYLAILLFKIKDYSIARIVACIVVSLIGLICFILSVKNGDQTQNGDDSYFFALCKKYSFLAIFAVAVLFALSDYVVWGSSYDALKFTRQEFVVCAVFLIPAFLTVTFNSSSRKISAYDLILFGAVLATPVMLFKVIMGYEGGKFGRTYLLIALAILVAGLFLLYQRFASYDASFGGNKQIKRKTAFARYLSSINAEYGVLLAISVGAVFAAITMYVFRYTDVVVNVRKFRTMELRPATEFFALAAIDLSILAILLIGAALSLIGIKAKKTTLGDFSLITWLSFAVCALITDATTFSYTKTFTLPFIVLIGAAMVVIRIKNTSEIKDN